VDEERLLQRLADGVAGVERLDGVLKNHLELAAAGINQF
jgi:hypothetical protein